MSGKILITGATGLIGSNVIKKLVKTQSSKDLEIHTVGRSPLLVDFVNSINKHHILNLKYGVNVSELGKFDYIIHGAGSAQPRDFMHNRENTYYLNSFLTNELLSILKPEGKFVFMSSTELYSGLESPEFNEDMIGITNPSHSRSCYIEGKRAGEMFIQWAREKNIYASSIRLSYVYGPGFKIDDQRVIFELIKKGILNKEINLLDGGKMQRTNLYVDDATEMILNILNNPKQPVYNVAGTQSHTILEVANEIARILKCSVSTNSNDQRNVLSSQNNVRPSINRYIEDFGKPNFISLSEGLEKTIDWFNHLSNI